MDRDEFMELVYETFADEPDNVLANGIIEAADAYVEHEKAQLSQEGTTSDLIDRQQAIDAIHCNIVVTGRENAELVAKTIGEFADRIKALPTIQPVATDTNVGDSSEMPNSSTLQPTCNQLAIDTISRQAAIDALCSKCTVDKPETCSTIKKGDNWCEEVHILQNVPSVQPEVRTEKRTETHSCDLVSRQAALEKVRTMQTYKLFEGDDMILVDKAEVQTELMMLPSIQPEVLACGNGELVAKSEPQWIPCSERMPETEEFVLASLYGKYRNTTFEHACEIADYADGEWCVYAYPHMSAEKCAELIEAWMPLPEPYQKGAKD